MNEPIKAKAKQGYVAKKPHETCATCQHFAKETAIEGIYGCSWIEKKNLHCTLGDFAVKKMGWCNEWEGVKPEGLL